MDWWDIYIQVPEDTADLVSEYLQHLGSSGVVLHEHAVLEVRDDVQVTAAAPATGWTVLYGAFAADETLSGRVDALQRFLATQRHHTTIPYAKLACQPLRTPDYLTQWQRFFHPILIADRLMIHPPWDTTPVPLTLARLVLDPGQAFGTGLHPSTHMCLVLLAQCLSGPRDGTLLDVGCGSGILSLAALKLGMATAFGVDTDPQTIPVAERNARLNDLQDRVQFRPGSMAMASGQYAVIAANIYLGPLVDMLPQIVQRLAPTGTAIFSGILAHQEAALQAAMRTAGLRVEQRIAEEDWVALAGQHASQG